jgi:DNA-binding MarR family transcriptional regulator
MQRATHATLHLVMAHVADLDLTPAEINALANMADGRPRTVSELVAAVGTPATTLTSVLDRLERRGHVTRGKKPTDRRSVVVELTGPGRRVATRIGRAIAAVEQRALGNVSSTALAGLRKSLQALTEVAG